MSQVKPRVFVSHSHSDAIFCREFVQGLRRNNIDVWYDEHNLGSGALRQVIDQELQTREHFIVILSPAAVASNWVNLEINGAFSQYNDGHMKTILPIMALPCKISPTLRGFKGIEGPKGTAVTAQEAVYQATKIIGTGGNATTDKTATSRRRTGSWWIVMPFIALIALFIYGFISNRSTSTNTSTDTGSSSSTSSSTSASSSPTASVNDKLTATAQAYATQTAPYPYIQSYYSAVPGKDGDGCVSNGADWMYDPSSTRISCSSNMGTTLSTSNTLLRNIPEIYFDELNAHKSFSNNYRIIVNLANIDNGACAGIEVKLSAQNSEDYGYAFFICQDQKAYYIKYSDGYGGINSDGTYNINCTYFCTMTVTSNGSSRCMRINNGQIYCQQDTSYEETQYIALLTNYDGVKPSNGLNATFSNFSYSEQ